VWGVNSLMDWRLASMGSGRGDRNQRWRGARFVRAAAASMGSGRSDRNQVGLPEVGREHACFNGVRSW